jgi:hypothetical protein
MHIFLAGVMQGARLDDQIHEQNYRIEITQALQTRFPGAQITDPWAQNPNSVSYDESQARHTFLSMTAKAGEADLLIAYLPIVSMGTAMEMWQAFLSGTYIIAITPHVHHWAIRFTANEVLPDLESFLALLENGHLEEVLPALGAVDARSEAD